MVARPKYLPRAGHLGHLGHLLGHLGHLLGHLGHLLGHPGHPQRDHYGNDFSAESNCPVHL